MTIVFEHHPHRGLRPALLSRVAGRVYSAWQNHRAAREMESLPYAMRKDIGFRSTDTRTR